MGCPADSCQHSLRWGPGAEALLGGDAAALGPGRQDPHTQEGRGHSEAKHGSWDAGMSPGYWDPLSTEAHVGGWGAGGRASQSVEGLEGQPGGGILLCRQ